MSPTLYQTDLRITNKKTKISTVIYAPFIQNLNQLASKLTATTSFPRVFFKPLQFSRQHPSFLAHRVVLMTKTDLIFPAFSSRFVDFAVQFCFCCEFSFPEEWRWHSLASGLTAGLTVAWFFSTNRNSLLHTVTNEIASFCIDSRLRQMAFFVFAKVGKGGAKAGFHVMLKYFKIILQ